MTGPFPDRQIERGTVSGIPLYTWRTCRVCEQPLTGRGCGDRIECADSVRVVQTRPARETGWKRGRKGRV